MKNILLLTCLLASIQAFSQGSSIPFGNEAYRILDRLEIKSKISPNYHSSLKSFTRGDAMKFILSMDTLSSHLNQLDRDDCIYMHCDNNEWLTPHSKPQLSFGKKNGYFEQTENDTLYRFIPSKPTFKSQSSPYFIRNEKPIWKYFYQTPANWLAIEKEDFHLKINPIIQVSVGRSNVNDPTIYTNRRGVEIRGGIDDRVYFYSNITDTQSRLPEYVNDYIEINKALPGNGLFKEYDSRIFNSQDSYDYLNGQGFIGINITEHIGMQFGHGKNFIGNGYRSLLLSDFSHNYLYLKLNWNIWKFHYQNLFTELNATSAKSNPGESRLPKKYLAAHYLSFNFSDDISLGIFEGVVFDRENGQFELNYLNPVILYRTVEHQLDSEDNVIAGLDFKWNIFNTARLYAQLVMDEYKFSELTGGNGWWANKFGVQAGLQWVDLFKIPQLDLRLEYNTVRPYTYTYRDFESASYSHYNQSLAHPLGANFNESIAIINYRPLKKWSFEGRLIRANFGEDENDLNWGGNILLPNNTHVQDFGNTTGQGVNTTTTLLGLDISYQIYHNMFFECSYLFRNKESEINDRNNKDSYMSAGFRMNIGKIRNDF